ncbi:hypothetical protein O181_019193 [Austropuccinia psidii MF-1]|uniref:Uncharacterized protein n=1 Tax=Austropuccinia psidii MF-1 TaxID=1389203 RepID=A0A9Q3C987_9BASI|nr:hypothetical protein [Austropuccinia psidii MF-1]
MTSSGHFDPAQTYDGYKAVECHFSFAGKKPCFHTGPPASNIRSYLWSKKDVPFGKEFPVSEAPTPDVTSGQRDVARWTNVGGPIPVCGRPIYSSSEFPISRINTESVVKQRRQIATSPPDTDAEDSDSLDGEEVEVVHNSVGHQSSTSPSHPPAKIFQSHVIPSTPRKFQPILATISTSLPPSSPSSSNIIPALNPQVRPSPIHQSRNSPIVTSKQLQAVVSSSRRREELSPLPFPATQVFHQSYCWPIQDTREDPNMESENEDAGARLFRRADRNSMEVIEYSDDSTISGTVSEEMAANISWYEDELINDFQRTFDNLGRDN